METVIITQNLTRHFDQAIAVDTLSLEIEQGEIFGLLRHTGAAKTTTVRLMNGVPGCVSWQSDATDAVRRRL